MSQGFSDTALKKELEQRYAYEEIIHTNNLVSKTDIHGTIIYVNDEFCDITGYSREELVGENHRILKPKDTKSEDYEPLWNAITAGKTYRNIVRNITKKGKEIYLSSTISPVFNQNNEIVEFIAIRYNITKEIELQKELELHYIKLQQAYKIAKIGTWEIDIEKNETTLSHEAMNILGLHSHPTNKNIRLLHKHVHKEDISIVKDFLNEILSEDSEEHSTLYRIKHPSKKLRWLDCRGEKIPYTTKIIGTIQDITERVKQEENLIEKERIISQQAKMATMGEMIANIAHQWRQPLSTITTAATGMHLQKELGELNDEMFFHSVDSITNAANHLSKTIDDFRNFFKPNKQKSVFDMEETFNRTYKLVSSQFQSNDIVIISKIKSIMIYGFENELLQVLINILKNAKDELLKVQGKRYIFIKTLTYEDELTIKIVDNAGGIPEENVNEIFEAYFTTKSESQGGTGLGLYMCKEIVEKSLQGTIVAQNSTYDHDDDTFKGALFTITLPINKKADINFN